jgi:hypothetical protein
LTKPETQKIVLVTGVLLLAAAAVVLAKRAAWRKRQVDAARNGVFPPNTRRMGGIIQPY